jgi:hypothetical protein
MFRHEDHPACLSRAWGTVGVALMVPCRVSCFMKKEADSPIAIACRDFMEAYGAREKEESNV